MLANEAAPEGGRRPLGRGLYGLENVCRIHQGRRGTCRLSLEELESRLAAPLSVLVLALLAVPLSHIQPGQGRYGKLVLGILAYLAYANLVSLGATWIGKGKMPMMLGLWWVHGLVLLVAFWLIARRQGWVR